jgi:hypothetical protein
MKEIPLSLGYTALVDDADYAEVSLFRWHAQPSKSSNLVYAQHCYNIGNRRVRSIKLHRFIMGNGPHIDHIDGNPLNNQRSNLRFVTHSQNMANRRKFKPSSSIYKGVHKKGAKWVAEIGGKNSRLRIGSFATEWDAALAYNFVAYERYGDYARLNEYRVVPHE